MPGPCPGGISTAKLHRDSKCNDRERCTGPGCRVYRPERVEKRNVEVTVTSGSVLGGLS